MQLHRLHGDARLLALCALLLPLLAACSSAPVAPPPSLQQRQIETLRALGFGEAEDGWLMNIAEPISFDINQWQLRDALRPQLAEVARRLLEVELRQLRVEGHTDHLGTRDYNEQLSLRRSEAVAAVFIAQGYAPGDIQCRGLGPDFPIATKDTRDGRAQNRRVSVIVPADSMAE